MTTKTLTVTQDITITVDESKFTPEFMANFNRYFHELNTVEDHMKYLAEVYARGIVTSYGDFLEGYGPLDKMGIKFERENIDVSDPED